ncbi:hypothetical protein [Chelativorans sp. YIM 93263]|uniref:hypothetical protein n=1 Tax=Chelativorans sp. YIM 93263 TaxID=2906648 RepID=UPI00237887E2|nr:hypothetical protein [Chelativorans sp. YIM 93263]
MTRKRDPRTPSARPTEVSSPDLGLLLEEIEKEPVPERLLELALTLQKRLAEKRRREESAGAPGNDPVITRVRQSP